VANEDLVGFDGRIIERLPEGRFRARLENDHEMPAYTAGRMKKNPIRPMVGDRVTVEMTPYDVDRARITCPYEPEGARLNPAPVRPQFRRP
jgi:translation initiation factor IF-1